MLSEVDMSETELAPQPAIAEEQAESAPASQPEKEEVKVDPIQKRIDKAVAKQYEALRKADRLSFENEQLKARLAEVEKPKQESEPKVPTLESSGFDQEKYQKDLRDYLRAEARAEARDIAKRAVSEEREQARRSESFESFEKRQREFLKVTPDYAEKVLDRDTLPISADMQDALMRMENGPAIAYYLCTNEARADAIKALPLIDQAREIGRIEAQLEAQKSARRVISGAPPPAPKLDAVEDQVDDDPDKMPMEKWVKWRNKQLRTR